MTPEWSDRLEELDGFVRDHAVPCFECGRSPLEGNAPHVSYLCPTCGRPVCNDCWYAGHGRDVAGCRWRTADKEKRLRTAD